MHAPRLVHPSLIDPSTGLPLAAIGARRNGVPIFPAMGGAAADSGEPEGDPDGGDDDEGGDDAEKKKLGDAGKQALDRMKGERNAARRDLRSWKSLAAELGAKTPEEMKALLADRNGGKDNTKTDPTGDGKPEPVDADRIRRDAEKAITARVNARVVRSEVKAAAAGLFADPADAPLYLDLSNYEVDENGEVDEAAIREDLEAVLERKPHLKKTATADDAARKGPKADRSQGSRGAPESSTATGAAAYAARKKARNPQAATTT